MGASPIQIEWFPVPDELRPVVHTFYKVEVGPEGLADWVPAYSAQLVILLQGRAVLRYHHGGQVPMDAIHMNAPMLEAAELELEGPAQVIGASLTALGWAALSGQPVDTVSDQMVPISDLLEAPSLARLVAADKAGDVDRVLEAMQDALRAPPHTPSEDHRALLQAVTAWLESSPTPQVAELYASVPQSDRHVQRLCRRYYGVSPTQMIKKHRAIRAAILMLNPSLPEPARDAVLASFFDQPHLIRDMRRYAGSTPARLANNALAVQSLAPGAQGPSGRAVGGDAQD